MTTLAAVALLSCGKEQQRQPEIPAVGFPEDGVVRISASAGDPQTRADEPEYSGTTLGLFLDYGSSNRFTMNNVRWTSTSGDWKADEQMLWQDSKTAAKLYAYAPYVSGQSDPTKIEFSIPADQSTGTTEADLVTWLDGYFIPDNSKNEKFTTDGKVLITFSHRLVKLTFNFEKGNQYDGDVKVVEATLRGTASKVTATFVNDPAVTAASDAKSQDIKLHKLDDLKYEAVFFPGEGQKADAKMLTVTMSNNAVLSYTVPSGGLVTGGLMPGKAYEMNMRLGKDKIEVGNIEVIGWPKSPTRFDEGEAAVDPDADVWDGTIANGFAGGDGSSDSPFTIATASQLAYLAERVNGGNSYSGKCFELTQNLILDGKAWTPIGNMNQGQNPFRGNFDGCGNTVFGLRVETTDSYVGLFGALDGGTVENVNLSDAEVKSTTDYVGLICGLALGKSTISGCEVSGKVTVYSFAGGVVGELNGESILENCKASAEVKGVSVVGGLCGNVNGGIVTGCSVIDGMVEGIIRDNNVGSIGIGGLAGRLENKCTIKKCAVNASVKGRADVGGLFGQLVAGGEYSAEKCTATGTVTVSGNDCGGLAGYLAGNGSLIECGFDGVIVKDGATVKNTGAAIGLDESEVTFTDCWYNAEKTEGLDVVGTPKVGADYSGIKAKKSGE